MNQKRPRNKSGIWTPIGTNEPMHKHVFGIKLPKRHAEYLLAMERFDRIKLMRQAIIDAVEDRVFES